jgi:hypothetical protein
MTVARLDPMPLWAFLILAVLAAAAPARADAPPPGSFAAEAAAAERARTASLDERIRSYAARVAWRVVRSAEGETQSCGASGSAIHLGGGLFVSAAHVVDQNPTTNPCAAVALGKVSVEFGDRRLPARVVAAGLWTIEDGRLAYPEGEDITLLQVDARYIVPERRADGARLCPDDLGGDAGVETATEYGLSRGRAEAPKIADYARIDVAAIPGDSGGGVFDLGRGCLAGIISSGGRGGTNYVPARALRRLIGRVRAGEVLGRTD